MRGERSGHAEQVEEVAGEFWERERESERARESKRASEGERESVQASEGEIESERAKVRERARESERDRERARERAGGVVPGPRVCWLVLFRVPIIRVLR